MEGDRATRSSRETASRKNLSGLTSSTTGGRFGVDGCAGKVTFLTAGPNDLLTTVRGHRTTSAPTELPPPWPDPGGVCGSAEDWFGTRPTVGQVELTRDRRRLSRSTGDAGFTESS